MLKRSKKLECFLLLFCLLLDGLSFASGQLCEGGMLLMVFDDVIVEQIAIVAGHLQGGVSHDLLKENASPPQSTKYLRAKVCLNAWIEIRSTPLLLLYFAMASLRAFSVRKPPNSLQNR